MAKKIFFSHVLYINRRLCIMFFVLNFIGDKISIEIRNGRKPVKRERILIIDFGGQYNQLVARRVRDCNVY